MGEECFIAQAILGRFVLAHPKEPRQAWTGRRWAAHDRGVAKGSVQVSNFATREAAIEGAREAGLEVLRSGYCIDGDSISCFTCGMTSHSPGDVFEKYCGACHKYHEVKLPLEGTVS